MSRQLMVRIPVCDAASLRRFRTRPGFEVCARGEYVWLRVDADDPVEQELKALPGRRFSVLDDGQLVPAGARVPQGEVPAGPWSALSDWMTVQLSPAALPGTPHECVELQLVRSTGAAGLPNVMLAGMQDWFHYAVNLAPQVRLEGWSFAVSHSREVIVRGTPLPPIKGIRYIECFGVAVEAGWMWSPPVDAEVVSRQLGLGDGDLALLHSGRQWDVVREEDFVRATRSSVRLSWGAE